MENGGCSKKADMEMSELAVHAISDLDRDINTGGSKNLLRRRSSSFRRSPEIFIAEEAKAAVVALSRSPSDAKDEKVYIYIYVHTACIFFMYVCP